MLEYRCCSIDTGAAVLVLELEGRDRVEAAVLVLELEGRDRVEVVVLVLQYRCWSWSIGARAAVLVLEL